MAGRSAWEARGPRLLRLVAAAAVLAVAVAGPPEAARGQARSSRVRAMTSSNWTLMLEGEWMLKFYAPWCPACLQTESEWETFARNGELLDVNVGKVDVTKEPGLSGRFFVTTLPTIFHAKDGVFRRYRGSGISKDLQAYILEKKWKGVEPVAGWKAPSSIIMSGMAGLFSLSGRIRQLHMYFTGSLKIPGWASYFIFVIVTLLIGLIIGLVLVLAVDFFYPPKEKPETEISKGKKEPSDEEDEERDDLSEGEDKEALSEQDEERSNSNEETSEGDSAVDEGFAAEDPGDQKLLEEHDDSLRQRRGHLSDGE